ncbi:hypothetical protein glysoja_036349 [Glycine soja]|uniref:Uncharacterized protein n=1 Tax=Glycine soja TaxID=3848 RepID=A0A0B2RD10_GLYSO|nr:hypothetical protein glysoja_036349 [Glycine soja]
MLFYYCKLITCPSLARKYLHRLRGFTKLKIQTQGSSAKKQAVTTITYLHSWSKIQAEITARRILVLKPRRKSFQGYIKEKKQQSRGKEPWHMPSLISGGPALAKA